MRAVHAGDYGASVVYTAAKRLEVESTMEIHAVHNDFRKAGREA